MVKFTQISKQLLCAMFSRWSNFFSVAQFFLKVVWQIGEDEKMIGMLVQTKEMLGEATEDG